MTYAENELLKNRLAWNLNRGFRKYLMVNQLGLTGGPRRVNA